MKKSLAFIIGASLLILPSLSFAQVSTTTTISSDSVRQQLIRTLFALVQQLEAQIAQIIATQQQQAQNQQIQSQQIQQIAQNTTPVFGSTQPAQTVTNIPVVVPSCIPNPTLTVSTSTFTVIPTWAVNQGYKYPEQFSFSYQTGCPISNSAPAAWSLTDQNGNGWGIGIASPHLSQGAASPTTDAWQGSALSQIFDMYLVGNAVHTGHGTGTILVNLKVTVDGTTLIVPLDSTTTPL